MCAEAVRRALSMTLGELVEKYRSLASGFGAAVPLSAFGLSTEEAQRIFSAYDEDYHISRFFHFSQQTGPAITINGFPATHVSLDAEIESIL
jgi:hypothetical protein